MKNHFFVKLIPPRPTFNVDMTPDEAALMQVHAVYWDGLMKRGLLHIYGPVMDPEGVYGMGVVSAENVEEARVRMAGDPAASLMTVTVSPMRAFLPS